MQTGHEPSFSQPPDDLPDSVIESVELEERISIDVPPPVGTTPPLTLVSLAAQGKRGAAWRLLYRVSEDDSEVIATIKRFADRRLLDFFLEWLALGAWAGKPFQVPRAMRLPHFRTKVSDLFLPGSGAPEGLVKTVLVDGLHRPQLAVRATAAHLLGMLGDPLTAADLVDALHDPVSAVRVQAAKALGQLRIPAAAPALVEALTYHDEALASQIRQALLEIGPSALPALVEAAPSPDAWVRWHVVHALGDLHDLRGLHPLVEALADADYAVAWMAARALAAMGASVAPEVLRLLLRAPDTPRLMETAGYVLHQQTNPQMKRVVAPVIQSMHEVGYRASMPLAVDAALEQLEASGT
jgi:hypothetical protein